MFFLVSGAAWLALALCLGVIAAAKVHDPGLLDNQGWLTYGRVFPAHINALVYGWGMQAAFAVMLWLTARLSRQQCTAAGVILTSGLIWNLGVTLGIVGILAGNGTGMPWMEFPAFVWPVLLVAYCVIVIWSFIQFRVSTEGFVHTAQWYIFAAMIWFPWVFITANLLLHVLPGHPVMAAGINAWYKSALVFLFFTPVALGAAYYLATQVTGRPIHSDALAKLGFWSLAVIAPWAGMQKLAGAPLPYFLPYIGAAAAALLFIPVSAAATNIILTVWPARRMPDAAPALRFTGAAMVILLVLAFAGVLNNLPDSTLPLTQFSVAGYGFDMLALYGFFSLVMFGATYFIVPRVTGREWPSNKLTEMHLLFSVYGMITIGLVMFSGGLQQGMSQENWRQPWMAVAASTNPYAVAVTFAWCLVLFSNVFFLLHLAWMWRPPGHRNSDAAMPQSASTPCSNNTADAAAAHPG